MSNDSTVGALSTTAHSDYNQHRANVRNYLVGLSTAEIRQFIGGPSIRRDEPGGLDRVRYASEYLAEAEAEENATPPCQTRIDLAIKHAGYVDDIAGERGTTNRASLLERALCELNEIRQILTGEPYYDYAAQVWIDRSDQPMSFGQSAIG